MHTKMNVSKKNKTIDFKVQQDKTCNDIDKQRPNVSALSSRNFSKYELLRDEDVLPKDVVGEM